jgi:hypothetical protein
VSAWVFAESAYPPPGSAGSFGSDVSAADVDSAGSTLDGEVTAVGFGLGDAKATTDPYETAASATTAGTVKNVNLFFKLGISVHLLSGSGRESRPSLVPVCTGCQGAVNRP